MRKIEGTKIDRVSIIDDDEINRHGYRLQVEDAELTPVIEAGPFFSLDSCVEQVKSSQAVLSDYKLSVKRFAEFNGAQLVAELYDKRKPAVLCTRYESMEMEHIRPFRARIPALLRPDELHGDAFVAALAQCIGEFSDKFVQTRKRWRTAIQIEEIHVDRGQGTTVELSVPSWTLGIVVRLREEEFPIEIRPHLKEGNLLHAKVNTGAERVEELYFVDWEVP
ncbi:MAG TPA: hypothetical protein VGG74_01405 [Kofleriaceae bacterium]|jgi:hypothetical protein